MGRLFRSMKDAENEAAVADILADAWDCDVHSFGGKDHIDFYAVRDNATVAFMELKVRKNSSTTYPTVFLALRKWLSLYIAHIHTGLPCIFVVKFTDGIRFINVKDVDLRNRLTYGGNSRKQAWNDTEPLIEVPIDEMDQLGTEE
jgi:hypothetical protein